MELSHDELIVRKTKHRALLNCWKILRNLQTSDEAYAEDPMIVGYIEKLQHDMNELIFLEE